MVTMVVVAMVVMVPVVVMPRMMQVGSRRAVQTAVSWPASLRVHRRHTDRRKNNRTDQKPFSKHCSSLQVIVSDSLNAPLLLNALVLLTTRGITQPPCQLVHFAGFFASFWRHWLDRLQIPLPLRQTACSATASSYSASLDAPSI